MADIQSALKDWNTVASSNAPSGTTNIGNQLDDNLRQLQSTVRTDLASKGNDLASASTVDLGAVVGLMHDITGTTQITSFGTVSTGIWKILKFEGALVLTHNATSLVLPGGANITTANGDIAIVISEGSGNWRCVTYHKAGVVPGAFPAGTRMIFHQDAAPTGWVKEVGATYNDKMFRLVNGNRVDGGTVALSAFIAGTTEAYTLEIADIPSHLHSVSITSGAQSADHTHLETFSDGSVIQQNGGAGPSLDSNNAGGNGNGLNTGGMSVGHFHDVIGNTGNTGGGGSHVHGIPEIAFVDVIICQKA